MEVHHHSHTARKKWTHYFWEFLMLFLAVFCGFLAEYQLEHKIEKDRERQFIKSLANDIKADIEHLNTIIARRNQKIQRLDSILYLLNLPDARQYSGSIYFNAVHTARIVDIRFTPNNGTLQQLKNSGGLRLIHNRAVADSISRYDVSIRNLETLGEQELSVANEYRAAASKIFDSKVFDKMMDENNISNRPAGNPLLLPFTAKELEEVNYLTYTIKVITKGMRRDSKNLLEQAKNLLNLITTSYHLK
jgi:hypothetical protein